ncbi:hypothetical protein LJK88_36695 [Paenibacillus sp. P26]|nr:hypothetical protein LJK88_36695 [Paenibacillus sp. P26]
MQEQFGIELEALLGVEARWNTANVEALRRSPWPSEDIESILEQWNWFKERQIVLGGYYTTRQIANIWNEIVLNGKNQREAIEDAAIEIDKEIRKKREEFGLLEAASGSSEAESGKGGRDDESNCACSGGNQAGSCKTEPGRAAVAGHSEAQNIVSVSGPLHDPVYNLHSHSGCHLVRTKLYVLQHRGISALDRMVKLQVAVCRRRCVS